MKTDLNLCIAFFIYRFFLQLQKDLFINNSPSVYFINNLLLIVDR